MKDYLLVGVALFFATGFSAARACTAVNILDGSGSPPVVVGNTVTIDVLTPPNFLLPVYLDGSLVLALSTPNPSPTFVFASLSIAFGNHTLEAEGCSVSFSVVATPPAPGAPTVSTSRTVVSGQSYTISWTVPSGTIDHYTINKVVNNSATVNIVIPASTTSDTFSSSSQAGTDNTLDYMVHACATSGESDCGPWSNTVEVDVFN